MEARHRVSQTVGFALAALGNGEAPGVIARGFTICYGASPGTRTPNRQFTKLLLFQLSYGGWWYSK